MDKSMIDAIERILVLLSRHEIDAAIALCPSSRVTKDGVAQSLAEYGQPFVVPPPAWERTIDAIAVANARVPTWSVVVPLWAADGMSDLSVELTVRRRSDGVSVEIDDIRVR
jgi:hypothetical protein